MRPAAEQFFFFINAGLIEGKVARELPVLLNSGSAPSKFKGTSTY
jgi:hypothetical protein